LTFDTENRPISYLGSDFTTGDITAIAAGWVDEEEVWVGVQTKDDRSRVRMLKAFVKLYDSADMVCGHFIRGYDLPVINGALMELGLAPLGDKMTCDTKNDLKKRKYISASQENLAAMLGLAEPKVHMNTPLWRQANRLTVAGIELTKLRCVGDVVQNKALRAKLLELDWLTGPKVWRSGGHADRGYTP
jgi:hypothetical protein